MGHTQQKMTVEIHEIHDFESRESLSANMSPSRFKIMCESRQDASGSVCPLEKRLEVVNGLGRCPPLRAKESGKINAPRVQVDSAPGRLSTSPC